jgi:hypothetical protein
MLFRQTVFVVFGFLFLGLYVYAQTPQITLSGTIYDENGALVTNAEIKVIGSDKILKSTVTNNEGVYEIKMPIGDAAIQVRANGFQTYFLKKYRIVNSTKGKMIIDVVLIGRKDHESCGYSGGDCISLNDVDVDIEKLEVSNKISHKPLEKLPKKQSKSKRNMNNKQ